MKLRLVALFLCLAAGPALAQENSRIRALGTFDQIATECARDGSEQDVEVYRLKLWHSYLGAEDQGDRDVKDLMASLRQQIVDDVSDELRRQYKSARAAIPEAISLDDARRAEFYKLCESPHVSGLPGK